MESRVLPKHMYRDPAEIVEAQELRRLGCLACQHHKVVFDRVMCGNEKNSIQFGVPKLGNRCKYFTLK
jgi:hypothetical protein